MASHNVFRKWVVAVLVYLFCCPFVFADADAPSDKPRPGSISGRVVEAGTGKPVANAYVGVGDFGDAGGSNLERFEQQGLYAHTKTDAEGRFTLAPLALVEHPLIITHPDFIRHDQVMPLVKDAPSVEVQIELYPAGRIRALIVNAGGEPVRESIVFRLEALDKHRFIPPEGQQHLSTFADSIWVEPTRAGEFTFTTLKEGDYTVEAFKVGEESTIYHGCAANLPVRPGEAAEARIAPAQQGTSLRVSWSAPPTDARDRVAFLVLQRDPGRLIWDDDRIHHPEDPRLGRIVEGAFVRTAPLKGASYELGNFPEGTYAVFVVHAPVIWFDGAAVSLRKGETTRVAFDDPPPTATSRLNAFTFGRPVRLEGTTHRAEWLCDMLSKAAEPGPRIEVVPALRDEVLNVPAGEGTIWSVLEQVCAQKGWLVFETNDRTLTLASPGVPDARPPQRTDAAGGSPPAQNP